MKLSPPFRIVLPTDELIADLQPLENSLALMGVNSKHLVAHIAHMWLNMAEYHGGTGIEDPGRWVLAFMSAEYLPTDASPEDQKVYQQILDSIGALVVSLLESILENLNVPDAASRLLRVKRWFGDSLVISTEA